MRCFKAGGFVPIHEIGWLRSTKSVIVVVAICIFNANVLAQTPIRVGSSHGAKLSAILCTKQAYSNVGVSLAEDSVVPFEFSYLFQYEMRKRSRGIIIEIGQDIGRCLVGKGRDPGDLIGPMIVYGHHMIERGQTVTLDKFVDEVILPFLE